MYLLLSGEGGGDIGFCVGPFDACDRPGFSEGPMAIIVDQLVEQVVDRLQGYELSHLDTDRVSYVSESWLSLNRQPPLRKAMSLRGKKKAVETQYFYENSRALATLAENKAAELDDQVVAVLFRDSDGTASAGRGEWADKRASMVAGFKANGYEYGVAMMPKPKSEAWLLCATKADPYQHCQALENESGNDRAPNSLKTQLRAALSGSSSTKQINSLLSGGGIDVSRIDMESFNIFKDDLERVVHSAIRANP